MHRDNGLIKISIILIGKIIGIGSAKLFTHPFAPFCLMPATSIKTILINANAAVTFMSFVGGLKPSSPIRLAIPMQRVTVIRYGIYSAPCSPSVSLKKLCPPLTIVSSMICPRLGFSTLKFLVNAIQSTRMTAMMIHVTTTDSLTGIPPSTGIVKTVSQFNSFISSLTRASICHTPS